MDDDTETSWDELAYIGDVTENAECPFCKNKAWAYPQQASRSPRTVFLEYTHEQDRISLPAIPLVCTKCGHIRLHDRAMVRTKMPKGSGNG